MQLFAMRLFVMQLFRAGRIVTVDPISMRERPAGPVRRVNHRAPMAAPMAAPVAASIR